MGIFYKLYNRILLFKLTYAGPDPERPPTLFISDSGIFSQRPNFENNTSAIPSSSSVVFKLQYTDKNYLLRFPLIYYFYIIINFNKIIFLPVIPSATIIGVLGMDLIILDCAATFSNFYIIYDFLRF